MIFDLQKASILKRASAFLLDIILLIILATGFVLLLSAITGYDDYGTRLADKYTEYDELYDPDPETATPEEIEAALLEKEAAMQADKEAVWLYNMVFSLTITIFSIGIFLAYLVLEFIVPLFLKNGMTIGKKVFGIAVVRIDAVKITPMQLFMRTFIGKFAVETMIPVLIVLLFVMGKAGLIPIIVLVLIPVFNLILLIATKNNYLIHDVFSGTVAVDMASQIIFDSPAELLECKKRYAEERASGSPY